MSTLIGTEDERWSLPRAVDALVESAQQAAPPGLLWIAGLAYPTLSLGLDLGWDGWLTHSARLSYLAGGAGLLLLLFSPCLMVLLLPLFRLVAGLARLGPGRAWEAARGERRAPRISQAWKAGAGLMRPAFALWLLLAFVLGVVVAAGLVPATLLAAAVDPRLVDPAATFLMGIVVAPLVALVALYALALSVLNQMALHSLAHNRRGVSSALLHGWRIMRHDPWATARAVLVDLLLWLTILAVWRLFTGLSDLLPGVGEVIAFGARLLLIAFAGVARAGYWARAYRALGGLSPDDGVPGLGS